MVQLFICIPSNTYAAKHFLCLMQWHWTFHVLNKCKYFRLSPFRPLICSCNGNLASHMRLSPLSSLATRKNYSSPIFQLQTPTVLNTSCPCFWSVLFSLTYFKTLIWSLSTGVVSPSSYPDLVDKISTFKSRLGLHCICIVSWHIPIRTPIFLVWESLQVEILFPPHFTTLTYHELLFLPPAVSFFPHHKGNKALFSQLASISPLGQKYVRCAFPEKFLGFLPFFLPPPQTFQ